MNSTLKIFAAVALIAFVAAGTPASAVPDEPPAKPADDDVKGKLKKLPTRKEAMAMEMKLKSSQAILAGIALNEFDKIQTAADELITISNVNDFLNAYKGAEYQFHMQLFRRPVETIAKKAKEKNMDGVLVAYTDMTLSCVKCHDGMRDKKFEIATDPAGLAR